MDEEKFIKEIQRRFPDNDIETLPEALDRIKGTEYEHIFSQEVEVLTKWVDEVVAEMELHNADEVGIDNQWDYEEAEYQLLLSDKYYNK